MVPPTLRRLLSSCRPASSNGNGWGGGVSRKATGLGRRWLARFEEWQIMTPKIRDRQKIYSRDDLIIGKIIVDMDRIGLGLRQGFDPEALKCCRSL